ncbi:hypothetical protein [uncultured Shimia sp.]|uniref:hypothetical protein n=1 Tax=uncultured Shimia sp. TaxID=573152 RepID=UPI0026152279|nr:hypothetical protein [uncultured Shimia sp.]
MATRKDNSLSELHLELLSNERTPCGAVLSELEKGRRAGRDANYESNTLGFEYSADSDTVSVFATFNGGEDEVTLPFAAFEAALRQARMGGS